MNAEKADQGLLTLERYLPYRLSILSNRVSGMIAETYKHKFALSITEWRIMAVLGEYPGISADEVSAKTQIEKSLISRAIAKLQQRKMVDRALDSDDRRRSILQLSDTGMSIYQELVPVSYAYEQKLLECFSDKEAKTFNTLLDRLSQHSSQIAGQEQPLENQ